jgi:hypothetical protein
VRTEEDENMITGVNDRKAIKLTGRSDQMSAKRASRNDQPDIKTAELFKEDRKVTTNQSSLFVKYSVTTRKVPLCFQAQLVNSL